MGLYLLIVLYTLQEVELKIQNSRTHAFLLKTEVAVFSETSVTGIARCHGGECPRLNFDIL